MTAEAASARPPDPDLNMGLRLIAVLLRASAVHAFRVGVVWVTLVGILSLVLLQINVDPGYLLRRSDILRLIVVNGLGVTIAISLVSVAIASVLALIGALGRLSPHPVAQGLAGFYVSVVRGTPLLIQLFLIYNGLAQIGTQLIRMGYPDLGNLLILKEIPAGVLALSLNYGAYMTEIFRAGIQSISHGQWEAAQALGLTPGQTLRRVILPQAVRIIIPDIGNQFIYAEGLGAGLGDRRVGDHLPGHTLGAHRQQIYRDVPDGRGRLLAADDRVHLGADAPRETDGAGL